MKLSEVTEFTPGRVIVFKASTASTEDRVEIDRITTVVLRWERVDRKIRWKVTELWTAMFPEYMTRSQRVPSPDDVLEIVDIIHIECVDVEIPAVPKFLPGERVIYEGDDDKLQVGTIAYAELRASPRITGIAYGLVEEPKMDGIEEAWITESLGMKPVIA